MYHVSSLGTDGASVMTGCANGVGKQIISSWNCFATAVHCGAHRNALASVDAAKDNAVFQQVESGSQEFVHYFSHSNKQQDMLTATQKRHYQKVLKMLGLSGTSFPGETVWDVFTNAFYLCSSFSKWMLTRK